MKNTINLIKINLSSMFKLMFKGKNKGATAKNIVLPIFLLGLIFVGMGFNYFGVVANNAGAGNIAELIYLQAGLFTFIFVCLMTATTSSGYIYKCKDYEMLASLPLKTSQIVISKLVSVFLMGYIFAFSIFVPAIIVYLIAVPFNFLVMLSVIIGFLFVPILPAVIGVLVGYIAALVSSKTRFKNAITIILAFVFMGLYFVFCFNADRILVLLASDSGTALKYILFSITFFISGFVKLNILHIILYVAVSLVVLSLCVLLVSLSFTKINNKLLFGAKTVTKSTKGELTFKQNKIESTLIKKEIKTYFQIPTWVVNSMMGLLIAVVLPIVLKLLDAELINALGATGVTVILACGIASLIVMGNITDVSISIEGGNWNVIKALPVDAKQVYWSKIWAGVIISLPFALISIIFSILLFFNVIGIVGTIFVIVTPLVALFASSVVGLILNLLHPNMEWQNVSEVVKGGLPVFEVLFGGMIINALLISLVFMLNLNLVFSGLLFLSFYLLLSVVGVLVLNAKGQKFYNQI